MGENNITRFKDEIERQHATLEEYREELSKHREALNAYQAELEKRGLVEIAELMCKIDGDLDLLRSETHNLLYKSDVIVTKFEEGDGTVLTEMKGVVAEAKETAKNLKKIVQEAEDISDELAALRKTLAQLSEKVENTISKTIWGFVIGLLGGIAVVIFLK